jgi:hypothetical protein
VFRAEEDAIEVDRNHLSPGLERSLGRHGPGQADARAIDRNVEAAPAGADRADRVDPILLDGRVEAPRRSFSARRPDLAQHGLNAFGVDVCEPHARAFGRQSRAVAAPIPLAAPDTTGISPSTRRAVMRSTCPHRR